jgi:hypothetical protein
VQVHGTTARVSAGAGEPDAGGKRSIANFHLRQIQIASGQDLHPQDLHPQDLHPKTCIPRPASQGLHPREMTSALSRAEVVSRPNTQSVSGPFQIAINIDLRQSINRTPDGVDGASHA